MWSAVPPDMRRKAEQLLGCPVRRGIRAFGGYAPSATFRLELADGSRAFFKGVYPVPAGGPVWELEREELVYRGCAEFLHPWGPRFIGSLEAGDWHALILEDLGPATLPPWSFDAVRAAARSYAGFHAHTIGQALPDWLSRTSHHGFAHSWRDLERTDSGPERHPLDALARLAGSRANDAQQWLKRWLPVLDGTAERLGQIVGPSSLLHLDTRSDNIRLHNGRLRIFDWNFASVGPPEFDLAAFAQSITAEGGPRPEEFAVAYAGILEVRPAAISASIAAIAGYFATHAPKAPIPGLPRLRSIQRRQFRASLAWAARELELPEPRWLEGIAD